MPVNHATEFLIYYLYFHTFLSELQIAPIAPILGIVEFSKLATFSHFNAALFDVQVKSVQAFSVSQ